MKIQILSDIHLEFQEFHYTDCDCDAVVLAGDIHTKDRGVKWAIQNISNKPVIYILGNHEFYGKTYPKLIHDMKELTKNSDVHVLENDVLTINNINFFGCTLWTDFGLFGEPRIAGSHCQTNMNDYKKITRLPNYSKIRSLDTALYHKQSIKWLSKALTEHEGQKNVVITHHAPTIKSCPDYYKNDLLTAAYVSNLENFIGTHHPTAWIHGHLHNSSDFLLGQTRIVCNPRGYPGELNHKFDPNKIIEIE